MNVYIDKGNEKQAIEWLKANNYPEVEFPRRRDHLAGWSNNCLS